MNVIEIPEIGKKVSYPSCWEELNRDLFIMIENSISLDLLARLYSSQLVTRGEKHLLDHNRTYYKLLRQIMAQGQQEIGRAHV